MVVVRATPTMGNGLFATCNIEKGATILEEKPILKFPPSFGATEYEDIKIAWFCAALGNMREDDIADMEQMHCIRVHHTHTVTRRMIETGFCFNGYCNRDAVDSKKPKQISTDTLILYDTFLINAVGLGSDQKHGIGLFSLYSRINHSCCPNTHNQWDPDIEREVVRARRDIKAGEQLFTSYIDNGKPREQRIENLRSWGIFGCTCDACAYDLAGLWYSRYIKKGTRKP